MIVRLQNLAARAPRWNDLDAVAELMNTCDLAASVSMQELTEEVQRVWQKSDFDLCNDAWVVVNRSGQIVGYADVQQEEEGLYSTSIYVHPGYRGRGIGTLLLWLAEERARQFADALPKTVSAILRIAANSASAGAGHLMEREGYMRAQSFLRFVLHMQEMPTQQDASLHGKLNVDVLVDAENTEGTVSVNQRKNINTAHLYHVYEKELRPGATQQACDQEQAHPEMLLAG